MEMTEVTYRINYICSKLKQLGSSSNIDKILSRLEDVIDEECYDCFKN